MWLRPVGEIGCTKIRCVELGSRYLGHAVDATDPGGGGIPALRSRQRLARGKFGFLGDRQARHIESNAARRDRLDELASRNSHCAAPFIAWTACPACAPLSMLGSYGANLADLLDEGSRVRPDMRD